MDFRRFAWDTPADSSNSVAPALVGWWDYQVQNNCTAGTTPPDIDFTNQSI